MTSLLVLSPGDQLFFRSSGASHHSGGGGSQDEAGFESLVGPFSQGDVTRGAHRGATWSRDALASCSLSAPPAPHTVRGPLSLTFRSLPPLRTFPFSFSTCSFSASTLVCAPPAPGCPTPCPSRHPVPAARPPPLPGPLRAPPPLPLADAIGLLGSELRLLKVLMVKPQPLVPQHATVWDTALRGH